MPPFLQMQHWVHVPLHSSLEAFGASVAIILSFYVLQLKKPAYVRTHAQWISSALICMGVLDGFHAAVGPGESFIWLHSIATFSGGMFFAFVWLTVEQGILFREKYYLPIAVLVVSVIIGTASILFPNIIPVMMERGSFTNSAKILNFFGGCLFLAASLKFGILFVKGREKYAFVFTSFCFLFGLAGLVFNYSELWNSNWWLWHFVRFSAYLIILYFVFLLHKKGVTERKRAEVALRESEEKYRRLFTTVPVGWAYHKIIVDENNKPIDYIFLEINDGFEKQTGLKRKDVIGKRVCEVLPGIENDPADWIGRYGEVALTGQEIRFENYSEAIDKWFLVTASSPERGYFIAVFDDVTERKQTEKALQKAHDELEQRVEERTKVLKKTHEQLLHAEKLSAIGNLSASIAHEFNNPLQGVMNIVKGIKRRASLDQDDTELVDMAVSECLRMRDLIKSLQDFNRPTSGRKAPMDIHAALDSLLLLGKKEYSTKKIIIGKRYAENMPQIKAVADQIKQVFLNLLNNAADACAGGGTITVETEALGEKVIVRVHDTGIGIKPEDKDHIFEPFFTTKPEIKGTGLGLSISYGIIKGHGGEMTVDSEPGKGTTFSVTLPIEGGHDAEQENPAG